MTKSGIPKRRCDHCLDLECLICSHVALYFYKLNREVPEFVMTGNRADISTIKINGWYDWIKFYDPVGNSFHEDKYYLGRYLGPEIDIGPALTAIILKMNEKVVHQSTYRSLTKQELNYEVNLQRNFDTKIEDNLGPNSTVKYFDDMNMEEIPMFEMYSDNDGVEATPDKLP